MTFDESVDESVVSCERSFRKFKLIKNYLRSTMEKNSSNICSKFHRIYKVAF